MQYRNYYAGEAGSKEPMPAKPAVEPIVEQPPLFLSDDLNLKEFTKLMKTKTKNLKMTKLHF